MVSLDGDALGQLPDGILGNLPVDLGQVGPGVFEFRIQEFFDEPAVVRQEQGPFAVVVQPASRINTGRESEGVQGRVTGLGSELAQHSVGFVEKDNGGHLTEM